MLCSGDLVTVAFSGGADSAALLVLLDAVRTELGITLQAAHLNHRLRGAESHRDEAFVRTFCAARNIPLICETADIAAIAKDSGEGIEAAARRVRYDFLHRVANGGKIATAHNADDNAETVLLNLVRGSGIRGLCGIPPVNGPIIRPLIGVDSNTIRAFCEENRIPYVVDSTNLQTDYRRNKLRHQVIPVLKEMNPALCETITRQSRLLRQDADCLDGFSAAHIADDTLDAEKLRTLSPAIRSRVIRNFAGHRGVTLDHHHTDVLMELIEAGAGRRELPGGYTAKLLKGRLSIGKNAATPAFEIDFSNLSAQVTGRRISAKTVQKAKIHNLLFKNVLDYDTIGNNLTLRGRRPGDAFTPAGRGCRKTLHKLFNECGIPADLRDRVLILADDAGILWVEGFGPDERAAVKDHTDTVLVLDISGNMEYENEV